MGTRMSSCRRIWCWCNLRRSRFSPPQRARRMSLRRRRQRRSTRWSMQRRRRPPAKRRTFGSSWCRAASGRARRGTRKRCRKASLASRPRPWTASASTARPSSLCGAGGWTPRRRTRTTCCWRCAGAPTRGAWPFTASSMGTARLGTSARPLPEASCRSGSSATRDSWPTPRPCSGAPSRRHTMACSAARTECRPTTAGQVVRRPRSLWSWICPMQWLLAASMDRAPGMARTTAALSRGSAPTFSSHTSGTPGPCSSVPASRSESPGTTARATRMRRSESAQMGASSGTDAWRDR
mmetsp:Transcript_83563/g.220482  ORF Transcript_83563/g.220482 Transcript_83563/m.220482 type:complete len:295 (+) Transcript_83563:215-1099(+)